MPPIPVRLPDDRGGAQDGERPIRLVPAGHTVRRVADLGVLAGPTSTPPGVAGVLRSALDEVVETAETVTEDLGHALEESVGEIVDALARLRGSAPQEVPVVLARAAGHVLAGWVAADRHAAARVLTAGRRLASLAAVSRNVVDQP